MKQLCFTFLLNLLLGMVVSTQATPIATVTPASTPTIDINTISVQTTDLVKAHIEVDNETPLIGEPFLLSFVIDVAPGITIIAWPALPQVDPNIEIIEATEFEQTEAGNRIQYVQEVQVRIWRTGAYITPEIPISYETSNGVTGSVPVASASLNVSSILNDSVNQELRPAASTIDLPYISPAFYIIAVLLLTTVLWGLLRLFSGTIKRTRQLGQATPAQRAIARLKDLDLQELPSIITLPLAADTLRIYLSERFNLPATEQTTAELLHSLSDFVPTQRRQQLSQILNQADLAKFAKQQPNREMMQKIIDFCVRWIHSVDAITASKDVPEGSIIDE